MSTQILDGYCTLGIERETALNVDALLRTMDKSGISQAVVAPEDREIALLNAQGNLRIAKAALATAGRLIPACTVNPWWGEQGVGMLEEAVSRGARMLVVAPALQGFMLGDELTDSLFAAAGRLCIPVYVHTGPQACAGPTQLVLLALRHSETRFILAHGGSTDHAWDMPVVLRQAPQNVWFELSLVRPWAAANYAKLVNDERLIFATSAPRNNCEMELIHFGRHLPVVEHPMIYGGTLRRLLEEVRA